MVTYADKLKDPRWQKKRLYIFERDHWQCRQCYDDKSTLVVHHLSYLPNTEPWDHPDDLLVTLCEHCHETINEPTGVTCADLYGSEIIINLHYSCEGCYHYQEFNHCSCRDPKDVFNNDKQLCGDWKPKERYYG